jgi:hypothetical protein
LAALSPDRHFPTKPAGRVDGVQHFHQLESLLGVVDGRRSTGDRVDKIPQLQFEAVEIIGCSIGTVTSAPFWSSKNVSGFSRIVPFVRTRSSY